MKTKCESIEIDGQKGYRVTVEFRIAEMASRHSLNAIYDAYFDCIKEVGIMHLPDLGQPEFGHLERKE